MADETRNAEVRLSADVDPYVESVQKAGVETSKLGKTVDTLTTKFDKLRKTAGQKLLIFGAGVGAGVGGVTKQAADLEKRMSTLQASAATTAKSMTTFDKEIVRLGKDFPVTNGQAIQLITTLDKLGVSGQRNLRNVSESVVRLSNATGEDLGGLTTGMVELGRQMGTLHAGNMSDFSNSLLHVSQHANTSATGVLNFAQAIAPVGRMAGMTEKEVLGIGAAFAKSGADGFAGANAFNTIVNDITRSIADGSPVITKYANIIGVTREQFEAMGATESVTRLFEEINAAGSEGIHILDQLGIDGTRSLTAIQRAVQGGGLRDAIAAATGAPAGTLATSSQAAMDGFSDSLTKTGTAMQRLAQIAGGPFVNAFTPVLNVLNGVLGVANSLAEATAGVTARLTGLAGGVAAILGGALLMSRIRSAVTMAGFVAQSSPLQALRGGVAIGRGQAGGRTVVNEQSRRALAQDQWMAQRQAWLQSGRVGPEPTRPDNMMRGWASPFYRVGIAAGNAMGDRTPGGPGMLGRAAASPFNLATWFVRQQTEYVRNARLSGSNRTAPFLDPIARGAMRLQDAARDPSGTVSRLGATPVATAVMAQQTTAQNVRNALAHPLMFMRGMRQTTANIAAAGEDPRTQRLAAYAARRGSSDDPYATRRAAGAAMSEAVATRLAAASAQAAAAVNTNAKAATANTKAKNAETTASRTVAAALGNLAKATLHGQAQSLMTTGAVGMKGAWAGARSLGAGALGLVGGPWGAAAIGLTMAGGALRARAQGSLEVDRDRSADVDAYRVSLGLATEELGTFSAALKDATKNLPKPRDWEDLGTVSNEVVDVAKVPGRELTNDVVREYDSPEELAAWLGNMNLRDPRELQAAQIDIVQAHDRQTAQRATDQYLANRDAYDQVGATAPTDLDTLLNNVTEQQGSKNPGLPWYRNFNDAIQAWAGIGGSVQSERLIGDMFDQIDQRAYANQTEYNPEFAAQQAQNERLELVAAAVMNPETMNTATGEKAQRTADMAVSALEEDFLGGRGALKFNSETFAKHAQAAGVDLKDAGERTAYFAKWLKEQVPDADLLGYASTEELERLRTSRDPAEKTRMARAGAVGAAFYEDSVVKGALSDPGDVNKQYQATMRLLQTAQNQVATEANEAAGGLGEAGAAASNLAGSFAAVDAALQAAKAANGDPESRQWALLSQAQQFNDIARQAEAPFMSRAQRVQQSAEQYQLTLAGDRNDPQYQENVIRDANRMIGDRNQHAEYLKSIIQAHKQYNIQLERMNEDRNTSLRHQEEDFQRSMLHAEQDFLRSREQQQEDFNRQLKRMGEDAAASLYDPMTRVYSHYTTDAGTLLQNLEDQNERIVRQTEQVRRLREQGLSQEAVDTLGLHEVDQAQNVNRIFEDLQQDPRMIEAINSQVRARVANATSFVQNDSNKIFRRSVEDFEHGAGRAEQAYELMVQRANQAQETGLARSADAFRLGLERMRQDMALMHEEIVASYPELVAQATDVLQRDLGALADGAIASIKEVANYIKQAGLEEGWSWTVNFAASRVAESQNRTIANQRDQWAAEATAWSQANPSGYGRSNTSVRSVDRALAVGGIAVKATSALIGEHGPEAVLPLNSHGTAFLAGMYQEITRQLVREMGTVASPAIGGGGSTYMDASTNFTGPISVQAQDPNQMARQLEQKARVKKLTRPSMSAS